jgi:hypothetical protein
MGLHICRILFVDDKVGEFVYEVNVTVGLPDSSETLKWNCEERSSVDKPINIPFANSQLVHAYSILQRIAGNIINSVALLIYEFSGARRRDEGQERDPTKVTPFA